MPAGNPVAAVANQCIGHMFHRSTLGHVFTSSLGTTPPLTPPPPPQAHAGSAEFRSDPPDLEEPVAKAYTLWPRTEKVTSEGVAQSGSLAFADQMQGSLHYTPEHCLANGGLNLYVGGKSNMFQMVAKRIYFKEPCTASQLSGSTSSFMSEPILRPQLLTAATLQSFSSAGASADAQGAPPHA